MKTNGLGDTLASINGSATPMEGRIDTGRSSGGSQAGVQSTAAPVPASICGVQGC